MKTAVLRSVSHDIRSPITAIMTASDVLESSDGDLSPDERAELQSAIRFQIRRLNRFVSNMLDLSKLEAGRLDARGRHRQHRVRRGDHDVVVDTLPNPVERQQRPLATIQLCGQQAEANQQWPDDHSEKMAADIDRRLNLHAAELERKVYPVPVEIDKEIARLKLATMGVEIDVLSEEQAKYLASWDEGT